MTNELLGESDSLSKLMKRIAENFDLTNLQ